MRVERCGPIVDHKAPERETTNHPPRSTWKFNKAPCNETAGAKSIRSAREGYRVAEGIIGLIPPMILGKKVKRFFYSFQRARARFERTFQHRHCENIESIENASMVRIVPLKYRQHWATLTRVQVLRT